MFYPYIFDATTQKIVCRMRQTIRNTQGPGAGL